MMMSLLDISVKKCGETPETTGTASDKRVLIFAGSKSSGKSTMIQRFLDKSDPVKETLALEYSFGRKSGHSLNKDICNIWELGGGTVFASLLPSAFDSTAQESTLILVLDLSIPSKMWLTLETILEVVYNHVGLNGGSGRKNSIPLDHEDRDTIVPFPVPLLIIGAKYDLFIELDPEQKKVIARTLRLIAHSLAASLFFYSDKDPTQVKKLKDVLNFYGFSGAPWKIFNVDVNKPLSVPFGSDSFQQIASGVVLQPPQSGISLERFKHTFTSHFAQDSNETVIPDDPSQDSNFLEPLLDKLRLDKKEELHSLLKKGEEKRKLNKI